MPSRSDDEHLSEENLESFSLGRVAPSRVAGFEKHLLICEPCRQRLIAIEAYNYIHYTIDGLIYSRVTKLRSGMFFARHWGRQMEGGKEFRSTNAAKAYLIRTFRQMFPEHLCEPRCGSTEAPSRPQRHRARQ